MQIETIQPVNFLYFQAETTVGQLAEYLPVGQQLFREAVRNDMLITGPIHWHYHHPDHEHGKLFTLEILLPVAGFPHEYDGPFHVKRSGQFQCAAVMHAGSWLELPETYMKLHRFFEEGNLKHSGIIREIYLNVDFEQPGANLTLVQMGIA